jgi:O-antigen/teichoic acid export membrane protein
MTPPGLEEAARKPIVAAHPAPDEPANDAETGKAIGLAAATMGANLVAVVFTVVFTRLLGADDYGSLAALLNLTVILFVPGSALQVVAAREATLGRLGRGGELAGTLARWSRHILATLAVVTVVSALARAPLADLINVDQEWAAAAVPATGVMWLLLCLQRGLLQSARAYREVGLSVLLEAFGRLLLALVLVGAGLDVTGAYLGTLTSVATTAVALAWLLRRRLGPPAPDTRPHPLPALARTAALPIAALTLVAALLNVDVIMAKHVLDTSVAGVYAATTVAAKALVWIAVGLGFWVLPEAARRAAAGGDPRPVLARALAVIGVLAACALTIFAIAPELLLRTAFGADYESGADVLLQLGAAYSLLAVSYLCVQFLLGLNRSAFILVLALMAIAEPLLLIGADDLAGFARTVLAVHATTAVLVLGLSAARRPR